MRNRDEVPRDYALLRARIIARHAALPKRLAQVAAFAIANPEEMAFGTAAGIAAKAAVQPSTLVRFAQAMGYLGFSDLQAVFRERLKSQVPTYEERLQALSDGGAPKSAALLERFAEASARSIGLLRAGIDPESLEKAVALLAAAETVHLLGLRRSFPVAAYMAYAFGKLGVRYRLIDGAGGLEPEAIGFAAGGDAVIAVSFTPYASATVTLAAQAAERGAALVAITDSPFSPLAQRADVWLEVVEADVEGFRTLAGSLALAMTLTVAVAEKRREG